MAKQPTPQKFIVQQSSLSKALSICSKALSESKVIPITENFLFDINGNTLAVSACDMKMIISTTCPVESALKLKLCIPGRKLLEYVSSVANQQLIFEVDKQIIPAYQEMVNDVPVDFKEQVSYSITVKTSSGKCSIPCESGEDFPKIDNEKAQSFQIDAGELTALFYQTSFAISDDQLRPALCGLNIKIESGVLTCTATDAHKLGTFSITAVDAPNCNIILPKENLQKLQALSPVGLLSISVGKSAIDVNWGDVKTTSRLTDGGFPDFPGIIPTENHIDFTASRHAIIGALKRIKPFSAVGNRLVKISIEADCVTLTAENLDFSEEASEVIPGIGTEAIIHPEHGGVDICEIGTPFLIGANADYLLSVLNSLSADDVWFSLSAPNRAIIITDGEKHINPGKENLCLLMPQMILTK